MDNAESLEGRCDSICPHDTPRGREVRAASPFLNLTGYRERCTRPKGHDGKHLGPSDVEWE
jgi:hypothetical protein